MGTEKAVVHFGVSVKPASSALIALLNSSEQFIMADLYTFTLLGGDTFLYSAGNTAITDQATGRYFPLGPKFERSRTKTTVGVQVDELSIWVYPEKTDMLGSVPWLQAAWTGQFDGATCQVERAFMAPAYGDTSAGTVVLFAGRVSDLNCSRTAIDMKCRSHLELLNIQMPRRLWQPTCNHVFGDAMCQFDRASLALTMEAGSGSTQTQIVGAPNTSTPFTQGTIVGLTGANAGQTRTIAAFYPGQYAAVKLAFLNQPNLGDSFQILPGCDRSLATCTNIFDNQIHFGGMPFIPAPENAV
jgi:uncharacterized phage protein (TIGR02218 family)